MSELILKEVVKTLEITKISTYRIEILKTSDGYESVIYKQNKSAKISGSNIPFILERVPGWDRFTGSTIEEVENKSLERINQTKPLN